MKMAKAKKKTSVRTSGARASGARTSGARTSARPKSAVKPRAIGELMGQISAINRSQAVIEFALDGTILTANDNFLSVVGYALDEVLGKHHSMFVDPAQRDSAEYRAFWEKLRRGEYDAAQYKRITKSGREVWIQASYNPIMDAKGVPYKVVKFATDVTVQKMRSADSEGQLAAVSKARAVIEFSLDGMVQKANDNFLNTMGYSLEEIVGKHHGMFVDPTYRDSAEYRCFWEKLRRGELDSGQYKRVGKQGREVWLQANYNPILDLNGRPFKVVKYATDITEQRLRAADSEGQLLAVGKSQAVIEFKLDGTILTANENFLNVVGYTLEEVRGRHHSIFVDPAQRDNHAYRAFWDKLGRGEYDAGQYKRLAKSGKEVWIQASYNPIMDMGGKPFKVVKYATDVTADKLRTADFEGQLNAVGKAQAVIEFNLDGTIITANENFLKVMGYTLDELRGKHHSLFVEPAQRDSAEYRAFWEKLGRGEYDNGQYKRIGKAGNEVWIQASYNPIMDMNGKPFKVVKYATDVTARRLKAADFEGQLNAVGKVQAVIEFKLDGSIITANENFLKVMGYTLEELRGKHHSLFVEAGYRDSNEYRSFWEKLGRGEYDSGQYKRIGKAGNEVWIQASYNPIMDMNGKPFKVVKYATDVTEQRRQNEMNAAFKSALDNLQSNVMVADGDLNIIYMNHAVREMLANAQSDIRKEVPNFDVNRLMGASIDSFHKNPAHQRGMLATLSKPLVVQLNMGGRTMRLIVNPMVDASGKRMGTVVEWADRTQELAVEREVENIVAAVAGGNFETRIPLTGKSGFFEILGNGINRMSDNMTEIVSWVQAASIEVSRGAEEISQGNADLSQRTEEQASSLEKTAASMEEMTSTVKQNADNSSKASQLATAARDQADKGGAVVTQAMRAMTEINESSRKIVDIIGVIDEIAFQTNLLALNAAVEAARAGEQGRGFAVVASEVRNLAGRSATAAKEIKGLIQDSVKKVDEGSQLVTQSGQTLEQIVTAVKKVSDIIGEIASASHEQSAGIDQVNKAVMQLDEMTQQNAALVEQASAASTSVAGQATALNEMMSRYKVSKEAAAAALTAMYAKEESEKKANKQASSGARKADGGERRTPARPWAKGASETRAPMQRTANGSDSEWKEF
jgi:methyl-accepting chemotaxis protein